MKRLSNSLLKDSSSKIFPLYRTQGIITPGICHVGVGNFHRAHLAYYMDQLQRQKLLENWGIQGIGIRERDLNFSKILKEQDYLYFLRSRGKREDQHQVIGSIVGYSALDSNNPSSRSEVLEALANPGTKIISMTITQGGYNIDDASGKFNLENAQIQRDLENLSESTSIFGIFTEAMKLRSARNPETNLTVMSCDNVQENGKVASSSFLCFIDSCDKKLGEWVRKHVKFVNSMVDRITPVPDVSALQPIIKQKYGLIDECPVLTEDFIQFVVEDDFNIERPAFEKVGVQMVRDVKDHQKMKLRLLNAAHSLMAYTGYLRGHKFAHESINDQLIQQFVKQFMDLDATPSLEGGPKGVNLTDYKNKLIERFGNEAIKDTLQRLCLEGSLRIPKFVVPSLLFHLKKGVTSGETLKRYAFHFAAYGRYLRGVDEKGGKYPIDDPISVELMKKGEQILEKRKGSLILQLNIIFGEEDQYPESFKMEIDKWYSKILERGTGSALGELLEK